MRGYLPEDLNHLTILWLLLKFLSMTVAFYILFYHLPPLEYVQHFRLQSWYLPCLPSICGCAELRQLL